MPHTSEIYLVSQAMEGETNGYEGATLRSHTSPTCHRTRNLPLLFRFGSRGAGVTELLDGVVALIEERMWPDEFSAYVYRASSGAQGERHAWIEGDRRCSAHEGAARRLRSRCRVGGDNRSDAHLRCRIVRDSSVGLCGARARRRGSPARGTWYERLQEVHI